MINEDIGKITVKLARKVIKKYLDNEDIEIKDYPKELDKRRGVFVTINKKGELRGCIGIPEPIDTTINNIIEASKSVCNDPRFPPLSKSEINEITVGVSILTEPKEIKTGKKDEILKKIKKDIDGLILENKNNRGLFLPQVWDKIPQKEDFLGQLCFKAGLADPIAWLSESTKLYKFKVKAFKEEEPNRRIIEER
ncbi:MAG: AmmeMemoRadiSam system protein A [Candidatus Aenigmatarchaeota archaeon]